MCTLIYGHIWYGAYRQVHGFRPYDSENDKPNEELILKYDKNTKFINTVKAQDARIFDYLFAILKKRTPDVKKENEQTKKYYENYKDHTVGQFFKDFLEKFDDRCGAFSLFYEKFSEKIGIHDFHRETFYLDL